MKTIPLTRGMETIVDDGMYNWFNSWKWYALKGRGHWYAARDEFEKTILMHREVMELFNSGDPRKVDHKNGNGLDNRRSNLRFASISQNAMNSKKPVDNTSGFKGVYWHKAASKWMTYIRVNTKPIYLGLYTQKIQAAIAYDLAALRYHKEFARPNFPRSSYKQLPDGSWTYIGQSEI